MKHKKVGEWKRKKVQEARHAQATGTNMRNPREKGKTIGKRK